MSRRIEYTPPSSAQVCASVLTGFDCYVERRGIDPVELVERFALNPHMVKPGQQIPLTNVCEALFQASRLLHDETIGLDYGADFEPRSLGLFGYLALSSETVSLSLQNMARFFAFHQQRSALRVTPGPKATAIEYAIDDPGIVNRRQDADLSIVVIRNILANAEGGALPLLSVEFEHERPSSIRRHEDIFGCRIRFGCKSNRILLNNADLDRKMMTRDPHLLSLMAASLHTAIPPIQTKTVSQRVCDGIMMLLPEGEPTLTRVAEAMHVPVWTLRRQLTQEGANFTELVDEIRRTAAESHLGEGIMSMLEIAQALGYAESSGLSRAFARWHGMSPRTWRHLQGRREPSSH